MLTEVPMAALKTALVPEVPDAGEEAGDVAIVAQVQGFLIALGAARVDEARYAGINEQLRTVGEREKSVGRSDGCALVVDSIAGFFNGNSTSSNPINLTCADAEQLVILADRNGV